MKKGKGSLLLLTTIGMELSWLYPLAAVLFVAVQSPPIPFTQAAAAFFVGVAVTLLTLRRNWRIIYSALFHFTALTLVLLRVFYVYGFWESSFFNYLWLQKLFSGPYEPLEGLSLLLLLFWCVAIYAAGACLARRKPSHSILCTRLDLGIAALFLTLIIAGTSEVYYPQAQYYPFSFFLFSITAVTLAKNRDSSSIGEYLYTYRGIGTTLTFISIILLLGSAALLLLLPQLIFTAEAGYRLLSQAAEPVGYLFANLLLLIFGSGRGRFKEQPSNGALGDTIVPEAAENGGSGLLETIISYGGMGLALLIFLTLTGWGIWKLIRWLLRSPPAGAEYGSLWQEFLFWLRGLRFRSTLFCSFVRRLFTLSAPAGRAAGFYLRLLSWGHRCGLPRFNTETPREYGELLSTHFPEERNNIELIIESFYREVYGKKITGKDRVQSLKAAWKKLCSPLKWPYRFKAWLYGGRYRGTVQ